MNNTKCPVEIQSTMVFLPPNLPHCPLMTLELGDKPILHFSVVMNDTYGWERPEVGVRVEL